VCDRYLVGECCWSEMPMNAIADDGILQGSTCSMFQDGAGVLGE
jgi:hypothetical protein